MRSENDQEIMIFVLCIKIQNNFTFKSIENCLKHIEIKRVKTTSMKQKSTMVFGNYKALIGKLNKRNKNIKYRYITIY